MTRRPIRNRQELDAHLDWLRAALRDRRVDARLILDGLLDAVETLAGMLPGQPGDR